MLLLDTVVIVAMLGWSVLSTLRSTERIGAAPVAIALLVLLAAMAIHLAVEGFRWQMVPAYLATGAVVAHRFFAPRFTALFTISASLSAVVSVAASMAFPIFELPIPSGPHAIGTDEHHVVDRQRRESYTDDPDDHRELMLRVYYPAEATSRTATTYWRDAVRRSRAVTRMTPLPWFTFTHLGRVPTYSVRNAPVDASTVYPVLIYSHGLGLGWASGNTALVEELASHGYVVVAINHAYIGSMSIFPDGRLVAFDTATGDAMNTHPPDEVRALQDRLRVSRDPDEQIDLYRHGMAMMPSSIIGPVTAALDVQGTDQRFVISQLERWQTDQTGPAWAQQIDLGRIGVLGMSLGGSAAFETCVLDPRCTAGMNIDGFHPRQIGIGQPAAPFLYLNRDEHRLYVTNVRHSNVVSRSVRVRHVTHFNFFDFALMSPLYQALGVLGEIDGQLGLELTSHHARVFFDSHLKGMSTSPRDYPGVTVEDHSPAEP